MSKILKFFQAQKRLKYLTKEVERALVDLTVTQENSIIRARKAAFDRLAVALNTVKNTDLESEVFDAIGKRKEQEGI